MARSYKVFLNTEGGEQISVSADDVDIQYEQDVNGNEMTAIAYNFTSGDVTVAFVPFGSVKYINS